MLARPSCTTLILFLAACTTVSNDNATTGSATEDEPATDGVPATGSTQADEAATGDTTTAGDTAGHSSSESSTTGAAPPLPEDLATELSDAWACGDILVHLANAERTVMLTFTWPGRLSVAEKSQSDVTYEVSFNEKDTGDIELMIEQGLNLDSTTCQPTSGDLPIVEERWNGRGGRARITVWPGWLSPAGTTGKARVAFTSLEVMRSSDQQTLSVPDFEREEIPSFP